MCGASLGERGDARVNSRNGCRPRSLKVSVGDLELEIPKLRHGTCYPGPILERWGRVDASLAALVVEAHANGASTRDMSLLAQSLGASAMSSSEASRLAASLDAQVAELRSRDLGDRRRCCPWADAAYARCRVEGRSVSQAAVTAIALDEDGRKRLVGPDCVDTEPCGDWLAFLAPVKARGLSGLVPCASDDHRGLVRALSEAFQGVAWRRRAAHLQRSLSRAARRRAGEALARELAKAAFAQVDALLARAVCPLACEAMREAGEDAAAELMEGGRTPSSTCRCPASTGATCGPTTPRSAPTARSRGATARCSRSPPGRAWSAWWGPSCSRRRAPGGTTGCSRRSRRRGRGRGPSPRPRRLAGARHRGGGAAGPGDRGVDG